MHYERWTKEEEEKLVNLINTEKYPFKEIGKQLGRTAQSCQDRAISLGIKNRYRYRKYFHNQDFWSIPNPINCYYGGYAAADSGVSSKDGTKRISFRMELCQRDKCALDEFMAFTEHTGKLSYLDRSEEPGRLGENTYRYEVNDSSNWKNDLERNFSIIPNKTYRLAPPNLNSDFLNLCYLIGMTDGDGCISLSRARKNQFLFKYTSASLAIIEWIQETIEKHSNCGIQNRKKKKEISISTNGRCATYTIYGMKSLVLFDTLRRFPVPKLKRKWSDPRILEFLETRKKDYPQFFEKPIIEIPPEYIDFDKKYLENIKNRQNNLISLENPNLMDNISNISNLQQNNADSQILV
jgi:hypothetical protein